MAGSFSFWIFGIRTSKIYNMTDEIFTLQGKPILIKRLTLRGWAELETLKQEMDEFVKSKEFDGYYKKLIKFIQVTSNVEDVDWDTVAWYDALNLYSLAITKNHPTIDFPVLTGSKEQSQKLPWEYTGRAWYFWLHLFASNYGWNETTIGEIDIDTAIGLYQEILLSEQLEKEWEWGLSEIAYPYNSSTKKQEYKAMPRPDWMLPMAPAQQPTIRIRKDMMPVGNIVNLSKPPKEKISGI